MLIIKHINSEEDKLSSDSIYRTLCNLYKHKMQEVGLHVRFNLTVLRVLYKCHQSSNTSDWNIAVDGRTS